jgi:DNA modification methylase
LDLQRPWQIINGDSLAVLDTLPAGSVHCCVFSPPYYALRDYGVEGQLGHEPTADCLGWATGNPCGACYVCQLCALVNKVGRVLRMDGSLWLNLGDIYIGYKGKKYQRSKQRGNGKEAHVLSEHDLGTPHTTGLANKNLMLMPYRIGLALQEAHGWIVRADIVWDKLAGMPESVKDRPTRNHETVLLLTKHPRAFVDMEPLRLPLAESSIGRARRKQDLIDRTGVATLGKLAEGGVDQERGDAGLSMGRNGQHSYDGAGRNLDTIWTIAPEPNGDALCTACNRYYTSAEFRRLKVNKYEVDGNAVRRRVCACGLDNAWLAHFATFPLILPTLCIMAGTSEKGCCPQCGAPYRRIIQRETSFEGGSGRAGRSADEANAGGKWAEARDGNKNIKLGPVVTSHTTGWEPGCTCMAGEPIPCLVLDPCAGAGTTLIAARRLNRRSIGVELNPAFVSLATQRIERAMGATHEELVDLETAAPVQIRLFE